MSHAVGQLSPVKSALLALEKMQARLDALERAQTEPIAIIGLGCRFPGRADDPEAFWRVLRDGTDTVTPIPRDRWDVDAFYDPDPDAPGKIPTRSGSFLAAIDEFDPAFFGISPREAVTMDPQQRLLLEVSWEALENAGAAPERLTGSATGVFVGICNRDYADAYFGSIDPASIDAYSGTGNIFSVVAGRVAHTLGFTGPTLVVDTACSSSLVAIHLACQSLRQRECDMALAGGVNLIVSPFGYLVLSRARALSADGRCRTFDARASGYGRGEGCGVVVLKRLSDAVAAGDRLLAVIRGSAVNHDGHSSGLTVPNGSAQQAVIRRALQNARVDPEAVSYVEAHGTGTYLGDPIEVGALAAVFGPRRSPERPLIIGSVKTNIGHLEAAAGVAALAKVVLSLAHQEIPQHRHLTELNPYVTGHRQHIRIASEAVTWPPASEPRIAGVSAFGLAGTNAHLIVEEAPQPGRTPPAADDEAQVLTLSARDEAALLTSASAHLAHLAAHPNERWGDVCYTSNVGRSHFPHRLAVVAESSVHAIQALTACVAGRPAAGVFRGGAPGAAGTDGGDASAHHGGVVRLQTPTESRTERRRTMEDAAALYVRGTAIDWRDAHDRRSRRLVVLPGYPFQRSRYWAARDDYTAAPRADRTHDALLGRRDRTHDAGVLFEARYGLSTLPLLDDHRFHGSVIVAGATYIAAVVAGAADALGVRAGALCDVAFPQPMALADGQVRAVRLTLAPDAGGRTSFEIISTDASSDAGRKEAEDAAARVTRKLHAAGTLDGGPAARLAPGTHDVPLAALRAQAWERMETDDFYRAGHECGMHAGPSFRWIRHLWRGQDAALAEMAAPASADGLTLPVHPGLLDSCFQLLGACLPTGIYPATPGDVPVVAQIDRIRWRRGPMHGTTWAHFRLRPSSGEAVARRFTADIRLLDERGEVLLDVGGLVIQLVRQHELLPAASIQPVTRLYEISWPVAPWPEEGDVAAGEGTWLLFCDGGGVGLELAKRLTERGGRCVTVLAGESFEAMGDDKYRVSPHRAEDFVRLLEEVAPRVTSQPVRGAVCLWSLDAGPLDEVRGDAAAEGITGRVLRDVLNVLGALVSPDGTKPPPFWLVTRGAQAVGDEDRVVPAQAAPWAIGNIAAQEHPGLRWVGVNLDPNGPPPEEGRALSGELWSMDREDRVAYRCGMRRVARLVPRAAGAVSGPASLGPCRPDGSYLVTGGFGALGRSVAGWLAAQGAGELILLSRDPSAHASDALVRELGRSGTRVHVAAADVAQHDMLARALAIADLRFPLRGVVHAAGVADDAPLLRHDPVRLSAVLAPKVAGSWNLHLLTRSMALDFFVLCSSMAAIVGAPGQGVYAAANAFLDALAHARRRQGLPALSIDWGPWAGGEGMAARVSAAHERRWRRRGIGAVSPNEGLSVLGRLLQGGPPQVAVLPVDWPTFLQQFDDGIGPPLFSALASAPGAAPTRAGARPASAALGPAIRATPAGARRALLLEHLRAEAAIVLELPPSQPIDPEAPLEDLGLDSLMAVELRNALEKTLHCSLPATLLYDYPTLASIADLLLPVLLGPDDGAPPDA